MKMMWREELRLRRPVRRERQRSAAILLKELGAAVSESREEYAVRLPSAAPLNVYAHCGFLLAQLCDRRLPGAEGLRVSAGAAGLEARVLKACRPPREAPRGRALREAALESLRRMGARVEPWERDKTWEEGSGVHVALPETFSSAQLVWAGHLLAHVVQQSFPETWADFGTGQDWPSRLLRRGSPWSVEGGQEPIGGFIHFSVFPPRPKRAPRPEAASQWRLEAEHKLFFARNASFLARLKELGDVHAQTYGYHPWLHVVLDHGRPLPEHVEFGFLLARVSEFEYPHGFDDAPVFPDKWYPHGERYKIVGRLAAKPGWLLKTAPGAAERAAARVQAALAELSPFCGVETVPGGWRLTLAREEESPVAKQYGIRHGQASLVWSGFLMAQLFEGGWEKARLLQATEAALVFEVRP